MPADEAKTDGMQACMLADTAPGKVVRAVVGDRTLAIANVDGAIYAIDDLCSHGQASLSEGDLDGHELECPFHGGAFDVRTGRPVRMPCTRPVRSYPVEVKDGAVIVLMQGT